MGVRGYNEARAKANKKYDSKTYKVYGLRLRLVEDKEIIDSIEQSKKDGKSMREWLNGIYRK